MQSSNIFISAIRKATDKDWDNIWNGSPYACFSHRWQWFGLWEKHHNYKTETLLVNTNRGDFVLPLAYRPKFKGLLKHYYSSPHGTYGGLIGNNQLTTDETQNLYSNVQKLSKISILEITGNPYHNRLDYGENFTHIYDLTKEWNNYLDNGGVQLKRSFKISQNQEFYLEKVNEKYAEIFSIFYKNKWKEWGNTGQPYTKDFFFDLMRLPGIDSWVLRDKKDNIVLIGVCLNSKLSVQCWMYTTLEKFYSYRPYVAYFAKLFAHYRGNQVQYLDLNPSGGHVGVITAKDRLGAERWYFENYKKSVGVMPFIYDRYYQLKTYFDKI